MKKLENSVWTSVISTINLEIENIEGILKHPHWSSDEYLLQRKANLKIALKEFETQQLKDLLS